MQRRVHAVGVAQPKREPLSQRAFREPFLHLAHGRKRALPRLDAVGKARQKAGARRLIGERKPQLGRPAADQGLCNVRLGQRLKYSKLGHRPASRAKDAQV